MKVCIVAHFAYGAMTGGAIGHVGGVERQTTMLARWLAARGHEVSLVTWAEGNKRDEVIDGVRVLKLCRQDSGLPGLRFFVPRWSSLIAALRRADADIYYHNCAEYVTGQVALWCALRRSRFAFSSASDQDCDPALPGLPKWRERWLYRVGLLLADRLIVQTTRQQEALRRGFGLASTILPMPCPGPGDKEAVRPSEPAPGRARVLWAARIAPVKRLELLIDIARQLPDIRFDVAGMPYDGDKYSGTVLAQAAKIENIVLHGMVPRDRMVDLYREASLLCCTSVYEGFPNTFLEAWSYGVPVVSTVDPDDLIAKLGLGATATDAASLTEGITGLLNSRVRWRAASDAARRYYLANHTVDEVMHRFERTFLEMGAARRR